MHVFILTHRPSVNGFCHWLVTTSDLSLDGQALSDCGSSGAGISSLEALKHEVASAIENDLAGVPADAIQVVDLTDPTDTNAFLNTPDAEAGAFLRSRLSPLSTWLS